MGSERPDTTLPNGPPPEGLPVPITALPDEVLREAVRSLDRGEHVVVATVLARHGSAPATPGQKLSLAREGEQLRAIGTVGGGAIEHVVLRAMVAALDEQAPSPAIHTFRLGPNLGMCCGGSADVLIEPMRPAMGVLLVGAGHVGASTAPVLADLGFHVVLVDSREAMGEEDRRIVIERGQKNPSSPRGLSLLIAAHDDPEVMEALGAQPSRSALVVMTHDHALDQEVIEWGIRRGFAFVGGVGSRAKALRTRQRLTHKGFSLDEVDRVRMPVGVEIAARRPMEIAIAIAAELVSVRAALEGRRDKPSFVPRAMSEVDAAEEAHEEVPATRRVGEEMLR